MWGFNVYAVNRYEDEGNWTSAGVFKCYTLEP